MPPPPPPPAKPEPSSPSTHTGARRNALLAQHSQPRVKSEQVEQHLSGDDLYDIEEGGREVDFRVGMETEPYPNDFIVKQDDDDGQEPGEPEPGREVRTVRGKRLLPGPQRRRASLRAEHRRRLDALLNAFMLEHRWKEAAAVLSVLLRWAPLAYNISDNELRRYHTVAMELHKRFFSGGKERRYEMWIKQVFDIWMSRLSWSKDDSRKKNMLLMELALFYFTQGNVDEAHSMMQCVIQDRDLAKEPSVNLLHGKILYQLWYSGLPEEFKITASDTSMPTGTFGVAFNNHYKEMEIGQISNNHYAAATENAKFSSQCASESSFGNYKVFMDCNNDGEPEFDVAHQPQEFYVSHSMDKNEQKPGSRNPDDNLQNASIFFAQGLDTSLLPIRLENLTGDIDQIIYQYRNLANEYYTDAVKHLRLALHSIHPVYAALLPLIQLLLLGDRVEEAFKELENSCHNMDTALPFRLMGRLLECFQSNKVTQICSCYENALKRDPICYYSLDRLVKLHKSGNCSTMLMFKMIALHLDAADGQCSIWEEFASCFLQLQTIARLEHEDCTSKNVQGGTTTISFSRIPTAFNEENISGSWKLRFAWWKRRHFSNSSVSEQVGDRKILCFKAVCASHIYGPSHEYVRRVFKSLRDEDTIHFSILNAHIQKAMYLFEHL